MKSEKSTPKRDLSELPAEFDKPVNTPTVNPRYVGMTPIEFLKRKTSIEQKNRNNQLLIAG